MKKFKVLPFNLETAKQIHKGEIEGRIIANGVPAKIVSFDLENKKYPIAAIVVGNKGHEYVGNFDVNGKSDTENNHDLYIALPTGEEVREFKPFEKVLVRDSDSEEWFATIFSGYCSDQRFPHMDVAGHGWRQCIAFEGNENLLGKTDKPESK